MDVRRARDPAGLLGSLRCSVRPGLLAIAATAWILAGPTVAAQEDAGASVRIAVLSFRDADSSRDRWGPTAEALSAAVPGHAFEMCPMTYPEVEAAVEEGSVDFVLTNTGHYVELEAHFGVSRMVTLVKSVGGQPVDLFGGVIFTRADRDDLQDLGDLRGKRFLAVGGSSLGGFLVAWEQLHALGIDPAEDFDELAFNGMPHDGVVERVMAGEFDAGTVRTSLIESMVAEGTLRRADIKLLNELHDPDFPFLHSTTLYPEWPFSRLKSTSDELATKVAIALLGIPAGSEAARAGGYERWAVPHNYQPVHDLMRTLRTGPYQQPGPFTLDDVLLRYGGRVAITLTGVAVALAALLALAIRGNRRLREGIAERERLEAERRQLERQVMNSQKMESLGVLTGGIAHDFNNILMAMLGHLALALQRVPESDETRAHLLEVEAAARSAAQLTEQMLAYSGGGPDELAGLEMNRIVHDIKQLLMVSLSKKVSLQFELSPDLPLFEGDEAQVKQIVLNLIINASEAIGDDVGTVTVVTRCMDRDACSPDRSVVAGSAPDGPLVSLEVTDTGCGMDDEVRKKLFDPFFTTKFAGRGLGLSGVLGIVRGHGACILVESEPGQGSTFQVLFPQASSTVLPVPERPPTGSARQGGEPALSDAPRILFVDDEETLRELGAMMLEAIGCRVCVAANGREALDILETERAFIDCVVLDMTMPVMNGAETMREVRSRWPELPVILSSGFHESEMSPLLGRGGAKDFLRKPYTPDNLRAALARTLGSPLDAPVAGEVGAR